MGGNATIRVGVAAGSRHPSPDRMEARKQGSARPSNASRVQRAAPAGRSLSSRRARGGNAAANGARSRGLLAAGCAKPTGLGEPLAFLRRCGAPDAPDSGRSFAQAEQRQTWQRCGEGFARSSHQLCTRTRTWYRGAGRCAERSREARRAQSQSDRAALLGGFSVEETAQALDISVATVGREQRMAEAWLHREMSRGEVS